MHDLIWYGVVGIITGWLASVLVQGKGMGLIADLVVGVLGAIVGGYLANTFDIHVAGFWGMLGMSVIGAVVLLVLIRLIRPSRA
jgi:uncharacterized membrane protein YeaQ/YmgE (transglycosylase-associated protein family)